MQFLVSFIINIAFGTSIIKTRENYLFKKGYEIINYY